MRLLLYATLLLGLSGSVAAAASGDHDGALEMQKRFQQVSSLFYEGDGSLQRGDRFLATYRSLSTADQSLCAQVCRNVQTMRETFCEQFMAAQQAR